MAARSSAGCSRAPTTSIRAPPTRSCEPSCISKGVADADIMENYTPFGFSDWQTEVGKIKRFASAGKKTAVISTINGDANVPFYKELANAGIKASDIPVMAFSVGEEELAGHGHQATSSAISPPGTTSSLLKTPDNAAFIKHWHAFIKNDKRTTNDPMEATYIGFNMWTQAVMQAGTTDVDAVRQAMIGQKVKDLTGSIGDDVPDHHLTKPVLIGEIQADGQFNVVSKTTGGSRPRPGPEISRRGQGQGRELAFPWVCESCTSPTYKAYEITARRRPLRSRLPRR